ncbi:alanine racemase [Gordonia westfalica]|uniref:D-serine deaminase, pyridoxal phosphate-dependent n=1 Tax=Gordonia westfalica TaxID=158898 RepID=A0A1H2JAP5_9ACTN|nr:alanine racemase [Gordonia westfalica]SDU53524.1 D-serine deaminase, pyridoxal phosphate-dependent [Gordonia westfalica]
MIDTPYLEVDVDRLDRNLATLAGAARKVGVDVRPHAKTHKCAEIARMQIDHGAVGLTVATIGEAEAFADAADVTGCTDIFIAYPLWPTSGQASRLRALAERVTLRVGIDSLAGARHLASAVGPARLQVLVEVDSGQHRTGVAPELAGSVAAAGVAEGLDVIGVFTFPGHSYGPGDTRRTAATQEIAALATAADGLRTNGIEPRVRSGGSTPTIGFLDAEQADVLTEIRPGVYPFNDAQQVEIGSCCFDDIALTAVATVVRRDAHRIVLDAGSKILGADRASWATGYGRLLDHHDARIVLLSEHHAVVDFPASSAEGIPGIGSFVRVVPNHVCNAVNLVDELVAIDGSDTRWPVIARGRNS